MRRRLPLLAVLLVVGLMLWLWLRRETQLLESAPRTSEEAARTVEQPASASPVGQISSSSQQPAAEKLSPRERRREIITTWEKAREKEVEFWGKVIDQYDEPVVGAEVTATITTHQIPPPGFNPQPTTIYSVTTDANGVFYIKGKAGRGFTIETMKKAGYALKPELQKRRGNLFWYNYDQLDPNGFKPEQRSPFVFRMWKEQGPERLVEQRVRTAIPYDGTPVTYDLLTGHETKNGGDLRITLSRNPQEIRWGQRNYEWTATIEGIDGGVMESNDEFMYFAPESGYQPKIIIRMPADHPQWTDERKVSLYVMTRDRRNYGRVEIDLMVGSDRKETGLNYHSFINPNGSRNLEYDPRAGR